jgi:hypothetical protein
MALRTISILVSLVLTCSGCATKWSDVDAKSVTYAARVPSGVSNAFVQGGDLWIVAEKNRSIVSASVDGVAQPLVSTGSYLKVRDFAANKVTVQFSNGVTAEIQVGDTKSQP